MTTTQLIDRIQNYKAFRLDKLSFNPDEAYDPANDAQNEILTTLRILSGKAKIALVADQELYSFSTMTVTGASNATPIVITTSADHPYNTGDTVIVNAVGGNTAANGEFTVTKLTDTTFSLDDSVGNGAYTSGGYCYHGLQQAFEVFRIRKTGSYTGVIIKKEMAEIEQDRNEFPSPCTPSEVQRYYEEFGENYTIGFQGVPGSNDLVVEAHFYRIPLDFQRIAEDVNPILPSYCDRLLFYKTVQYMLANYEQDGKQEIISRYLAEAVAFSDREMERVKAVKSEQRRQRPVERSKLRW